MPGDTAHGRQHPSIRDVPTAQLLLDHTQPQLGQLGRLVGAGMDAGVGSDFDRFRRRRGGPFDLGAYAAQR